MCNTKREYLFCALGRLTISLHLKPLCVLVYSLLNRVQSNPAVVGNYWCVFLIVFYLCPVMFTPFIRYTMVLSYQSEIWLCKLQKPLWRVLQKCLGDEM